MLPPLHQTEPKRYRSTPVEGCQDDLALLKPCAHPRREVIRQIAVLAASENRGMTTLPIQGIAGLKGRRDSNDQLLSTTSMITTTLLGLETPVIPNPRRMRIRPLQICPISMLCLRRPDAALLSYTWEQPRGHGNKADLADNQS